MTLPGSAAQLQDGLSVGVTEHLPDEVEGRSVEGVGQEDGIVLTANSFQPTAGFSSSAKPTSPAAQIPSMVQMISRCISSVPPPTRAMRMSRQARCTGYSIM